MVAKRRLLDSLLNKLPARAKRAIFLVSLYAETSPNGKSASELGELNNALALADDPEALRLPVMFRERIWGSFSSELNGAVQASTLGEQQSLLAAKNLVHKTPWWLEYANSEEMVRDLQRLFSILGPKTK